MLKDSQLRALQTELQQLYDQLDRLAEARDNQLLSAADYQQTAGPILARAGELEDRIAALQAE